jgi:hypothetical protein
MIFLNILIYQIPKVEIFWSSFDISRAFYTLAAILNFSAILHLKKRPQDYLFFFRHTTNFFYLHLDASKSAKTPFLK